MKPQDSDQPPAFNTASTRTVKGLLLEMKLALSSEERILAEEMLLQEFDARDEEVKALRETLDIFIKSEQRIGDHRRRYLDARLAALKAK